MDNFTSGQLTDIPLPNALANRAQVFVRWLVASDTSVNGGTVTSGGESLIDDIYIKGATYSSVNADLQVTVSAAPSPAYLFTDLNLTVTVTNKGLNTLSSVLLTADLPGNAEYVGASHSGVRVGENVSWEITNLGAHGSVQRVVTIRPTSAGNVSTDFALLAAETPVNAATWSVNSTVSAGCSPSSSPIIVNSNRTVTVGQLLAFPVQAYLTGCTPDTLTVTHGTLPSGATMGAQAVSGQYMQRAFSWTPGATGTYPVLIEATDGGSSTSRVVLIYVAGVGEELDANGVPISQVNWSPEILDIDSPNSASAEVTWATTPGITYVLYSSTNLPGGTMQWTVEQTVTATGAQEAYTVSANASRRYYQVAPLGQTPNPNSAWAVIRPSVPTGYSMKGPPLVTDRVFDGTMGDILAAALTGNVDPESADQILIWEGTWRYLYLNNNGVWCDESNGQPSTLELSPGQGFFVLRRGGATTPTFIGPVGNTGTSTIEIVPGWNILSLSEGRQVKIGTAFSQVIAGSGPVGATLDSSDQVVVQLTNGTWVSFVRLPNGQWRNMSNGDTSGSFVLEPGMAYYYYRQNSGGNMTIQF